ncbi:hypothetical protein L6164_013469 [Bauhinia variegata]|uniref:Uncharacterized protein n=1 Tax=Bauhinia variegata TaxID=167791 RepID=A0ACB9NFQ0_BAUVA|nr:hypothetical protein L6164_013469 [Bauhinia variegata]
MSIEMEHSLSSLTFKGSIPQAIAEAKTQRKLFAVYISGENAESSNLDQSTWTNGKVAESVSKYCILLHVSEGSADAANFSAIYPQKPTPCITVVGYNGLQLWQNEGFVSAEVLASNIERAWLSLHLQETATALSAALSSRQAELSTSVDSDIAASNQDHSSGTVAPSPSLETFVQMPVPIREVDSEKKEERNIAASNQDHSSGSVAPSPSLETSAQMTEPIREFVSEKEEESVGPECAVSRDITPSKLCDAPKSDSAGDDQTTSCTTATKVESNPIMANAENRETPIASLDEGMSADNHSDIAKGSLKSSDSVETTSMHGEKYKAVNDAVDEAENHMGTDKSIDAHLNIRLPNGVSLQAKFPMTSTLKMVKDHVDKNKASEIGSYDLAIPYPRKVFDDRDLSKSLLELGLSGRQALILVPHQKPDRMKGLSVSEKTDYFTEDSTGQTAGGYFQYAKRILSFINPFSYIGGGSNASTSVEESDNGMWQYQPNPSLQNNLRGAGRPYSPYQPNQNNQVDENRDSSRNKKPTSSRFGANIHTLKHDDDDSRFSDRNAFWNGNSTQYGGDNGSK